MSERTIFLNALDIPERAQRDAYLDQACAGDGGLRQNLAALLKAHEDASGFLEKPAVEQMTTGAAAADTPVEPGTPADQNDGAWAKAAESNKAEATQAEASTAADHDLSFLAAPTRPGHLGRLGHYQIQAIIGKGGFGIVLKGFDERLHRVVAVKVLSPAYAANGAARKRFIREARAAAAVKNEHVVGIYDVQEEAQPPFLVMECVDGLSLQDKLDKHGALGIKEVLRIGMQIAEGLANAHNQGLVHRDIKPANILLENGVERVKITDFGLARAVDDASVTQSGVVAGTPMYMSPEQAEGLPIDHRSDLFSLGTVLYAMCTGHPPFRASGTHAVLKRVIDASPRPIREINNETPDWLCDIISKLHAKKPQERFQTAKEVAELLGLRLADVQAGRAASVSDRSKAPAKGAETPVADAPGAPTPRRSPLAWAGLILLALLGVFFFVPSVLRYVTNRADVEFLPQEGMLDVIVLKDDVSVTDWMGLKKSRIVSLAPGRYQINGGTMPGYAMAGWELTISTLFSSRTLTRAGPSCVFYVQRGEHVAVRPLTREAPVAVSGNRIEADGWVQLFNGKDLTGWKTHPDQPGNWDVQNGILTCSAAKTLLFTERDDYQSFHLVVDGKITHAGNSGIYFRSRFGPLQLKLTDPVLGYQANIHCGTLKTSQTGALFVDRVRSIPVSERLHRPDEWFRLEIIAQDNRLITKVNGKTTVDYIDVKRLFTTGHIALENVFGGSVIQFRKIEIKELPPEHDADVQPLNLTEVRRFEAPNRMVMSAAVSADGRYLLSGHQGGHVALWDLKTGKAEQALQGHGEHSLWKVGFSRDGTAFTCSSDQTARSWDAQSGEEIRAYKGHTGWVSALALSPDGKHLVTGSKWYAHHHEGIPEDNTLRWWDVETGKEIRRFEEVHAPIVDVAFSPDGKVIVACGPGLMGIWDVETGKIKKKFPRGAFSVAFSPDGSQLASSHGSADPVIVLWDVENGWEIRRFKGHTAGIHAVVFSPDGRLLASGSGGTFGRDRWIDADDNSVRLWDVATGEEVACMDVGMTVRTVAFTPDGRHLVVGGGREISAGGAADLRLWRFRE